MGGRNLFLLLGAVLALSACVSPATPPRDVSGRPVLDARELARETHDEINRARRAENLPPLQWDEALVPLAQAHSADMARRAFFAHVNPDGQDVNARARALGLSCEYRTGTVVYQGYGENLFQSFRYAGYEQTTGPGGTKTSYDWRSQRDLARQATVEWLNSPGHRRNMLNPAYRTHALGIAFGDNDAVYFTDVFC